MDEVDNIEDSVSDHDFCESCGDCVSCEGYEHYCSICRDCSWRCQHSQELQQVFDKTHSILLNDDAISYEALQIVINAFKECKG